MGTNETALEAAESDLVKVLSLVPSLQGWGWRGRMHGLRRPARQSGVEQGLSHSAESGS